MNLIKAGISVVISSVMGMINAINSLASIFNMIFQVMSQIMNIVNLVTQIMMIANIIQTVIEVATCGIEALITKVILPVIAALIISYAIPEVVKNWLGVEVQQEFVSYDEILKIALNGISELVMYIIERLLPLLLSYLIVNKLKVLDMISDYLEELLGTLDLLSVVILSPLLLCMSSLEENSPDIVNILLRLASNGITLEDLLQLIQENPLKFAEFIYAIILLTFLLLPLITWIMVKKKKIEWECIHVESKNEKIFAGVSLAGLGIFSLYLGYKLQQTLKMFLLAFPNGEELHDNFIEFCENTRNAIIIGTIAYIILDLLEDYHITPLALITSEGREVFLKWSKSDDPIKVAVSWYVQRQALWSIPYMVLAILEAMLDLRYELSCVKELIENLAAWGSLIATIFMSANLFYELIADRESLSRLKKYGKKAKSYYNNLLEEFKGHIIEELRRQNKKELSLNDAIEIVKKKFFNKAVKARILVDTLSVFLGIISYFINPDILYYGAESIIDAITTVLDMLDNGRISIIDIFTWIVPLFQLGEDIFIYMNS